jgi:hypothetical protein
MYNVVISSWEYWMEFGMEMKGEKEEEKVPVCG